MGEKLSTNDLELVRPGRRGGLHDEMLAEVAKLEPGEAYVISPPDDLEVERYRMRISAAVHARKKELPHTYKVRTTVDGRVAVCCEATP